MRIFLKATQDATIYERLPELNTGLDEVLEVGKYVKPTDGDVMYASGSARSLLNFDIDTSSPFPSNAAYYLNLYLANATFVNRYQTMDIFPISRSWSEGSGYKYQDAVNVKDGCSWIKATKTQNWESLGSDYVTASVSASYEFSTIPTTPNIRINVTNIIKPVVSGSNQVPWNGLILKLPNIDEIDQTNKTNIKFFSSNTHTVFEPSLEVVWNSQTFVTGSLKPIPNSNVNIVPRNIKEAYVQGEVDKIYLVIRDPYPDKRFDAAQRYKNQYYLPSESYFRIIDQASDIELYKFDEYSAISCDTSGSYIALDTTGLNINRYYTLDLKIKSADLVFFPEFRYTFKIDADE